MFDDLKRWICRERPLLAPSSPSEVALGYVDRQWQPLTELRADATLHLDNNPSELERGHQVVGRKNWLFCASDNGAHGNATLVPLLASCRMHGVEPWAYLRDVLTILPWWSKAHALALAPSSWEKTRQPPETGKLLEDCRLFGRASGHGADDAHGTPAGT